MQQAVALPPQPGRIAKYDSEYERRGTANIFMAVEPLAKRRVRVTDRRTRIDWAQFVRFLLLTVYPEAVVVLVMDNLNPSCRQAFFLIFCSARIVGTLVTAGSFTPTT